MLNRLGGGKVATVWLVGLVLLCVGLAGVFVYDDDADAAKKKELKTLWAVVEQGGDLRVGKGVTSSEKLSTGAYRVTFDRNISSCATVATPSDGFIGEIGTVIETPPVTSPDVTVSTRDSAGNVQDKTFHLVVNC